MLVNALHGTLQERIARPVFLSSRMVRPGCAPNRGPWPHVLMFRTAPSRHFKLQKLQRSPPHPAESGQEHVVLGAPDEVVWQQLCPYAPAISPIPCPRRALSASPAPTPSGSAPQNWTARSPSSAVTGARRGRYSTHPHHPPFAEESARHARGIIRRHARGAGRL